MKEKWVDMIRSQRLAYWTVPSLFVLAMLFAFPLVPHAQTATKSVEAAVYAMELASGAPVEATFSPITGLATFVATKVGHPIPVPGPDGDSPEKICLAFFASYGAAFGISDNSQLQLNRLRGPDEVGMHHVRFQQSHNGVPVRAAELTVHLRGTSVITVQANTLLQKDLVDTIPSLTPAGATHSAQNLIVEKFGITDAALSTPSLEIFNIGIFNRTRTPTQLAWFIEATKPDLPLQELIWVDAQTGDILHHFSKIADALTRSIYLNQTTGTLARSEGQAATGDREVDLAYDYSGDTYYYFLNHHGRDSWDNKGSPLISVVRYANPQFCSEANAHGGGGTAWYCEGSIVDDIVGHEITHSILGFEGVSYVGETVPISEGYCWIFGETIDLTNSRGNDSPEMRWKGAEDIMGTPGFDMMNPTDVWQSKASFPGKVSDPETGCGNDDTNYFNFTILTHTYALMSDGGIYNGYTISGIGLDKAAKIHYRSMTTYLS
jgi:bacillolysin